MKVRTRHMSSAKKKNRISDYNIATVVVDVIMLLLGLTFIIGFATGAAMKVLTVFIQVVGGVLIAIAIFELINFLRIKEKAVFDWIVMIIGSAIGILGIILIVKPDLLENFIRFIFAIIIWIYAVSIIFTAVIVLKPAGAKYWWFSLLFGFAAFVLGIFVMLQEGTMILLIGITLLVGAIGGLANAILASHAKREFKKSSKILEDATVTVESTTVVGDSADSKDSDSDNIKY